MSREKFHLFLSAFLFTIPLAAAQNAQAEESVPVPPQPSAEAQAPEAGSDRFDFADGLYARGMYDMASAEYEKLIAEMPSHSRTPDALFRLAESFFFQNKTAEAAPLYEKFLASYADRPQAETARLRTAELFERAGKTDEALAGLEPLTQSAAAGIKNSALYLKGKILFTAEKLPEASAAFEPLAAAPGADNPFSAIAHYYLGEIASKSKDFTKAAEHFEAARQTDKKDMQQLAAAGLGQAYVLAGNLEKAQEAFLQAYQIKADPAATQEALYYYAKTLYDLKQYEEALKAIKAETSAPQPPSLRFVEAACLEALNRHDEALQVFDAVLALPDLKAEEKETAELGKIETYLHMDKPAEALAAAQAAPQERAYYKDRWAYLMAETLRRNNQPKEALTWLDKMITEFPSSPYASQAALNRGYILYEAGDSKSARSAFDDFMKAHPDDAETLPTLKNRITLDIKLEDWQAAIQTSTTFLELFGTSPEAQDVQAQLASLYLQVEDFESAVKTFEAFLTQYPDSPKKGEIRFFLAYANQLAGHLEKAVSIYREVTQESVTPDLYSAALKNTGYCLVRLDKIKEAAAAYRRWISEIPEADASPDVFFWLADQELRDGDGDNLLKVMETFQKRPGAEASKGPVEYYLGEAYRLKKDPDQAVTHYDASLAAPNEFKAKAVFGKALANAARSHFDEAAAGFEQSIREASGDNALTLQARLELGNLHEIQSHFLDAAKAFFAAGILYDDLEHVPEALFKAGEMFEKAGKPEEAVKAYDELTKRFPNHPRAKEAAAKSASARPS